MGQCSSSCQSSSSSSTPQVENGVARVDDVEKHLSSSCHMTKSSELLKSGGKSSSNTTVHRKYAAMSPTSVIIPEVTDYTITDTTERALDNCNPIREFQSSTTNNNKKSSRMLFHATTPRRKYAVAAKHKTTTRTTNGDIDHMTQQPLSNHNSAQSAVQFSQVQMSLQRITIGEDTTSEMIMGPSDEEGDGDFNNSSRQSASQQRQQHRLRNNNSNSRQQHTQKPMQPTTKSHKTSMVGPATVLNATTTNSAAVLYGPLSPVMVKTACLVQQPNSIRMYHPSSASTTTTQQQQHERIDHRSSYETTNIQKSTSTAMPYNDDDNVDNNTDAIAAGELSNFQKLKLQVAVAERHSVKQRVVAKLVDRVQDVEQHRQLWNKYQQIQSKMSEQQQKGSSDDSMGMMDKEEASLEQPLSPRNTTSTSKDAQKSRPKKKRLMTKSKQRHSDVVDSSNDSFDDENLLSENEQPASNKKNAALSSRKDKAPMSSVKKQRRNNNKDRKGSNRKSKQQQQQQSDRSDAFHLQQSGSWFIDFQQDEFKVPVVTNTSSTTPKATTTTTIPSNSSAGGDVDSTALLCCDSTSQAELSLLSAASMEVQRRLFAEKRRQRERKKAARARASVNNNDYHQSPHETTMITPKHRHIQSETGLAVVDETPIIRNGRMHQGSNTPVGSAQQLLCLSGPQQLQLATDILLHSTNRGGGAGGLTNMEVAFCSPPPTEQHYRNTAVDTNVALSCTGTETDNYSMVSDLDDTMSFSSLRSNGSRNDYGVNRTTTTANSRRRRSTNRRGSSDDYGADHSSIVSGEDDDISNNNSSTGGGQRPTTDLDRVVAFDFQSILQRRLDIEARLKALVAVDDNNSDHATSPTTPIGVLPLPSDDMHTTTTYLTETVPVTPGMTVSPSEGVVTTKDNDRFDSNAMGIIGQKNDDNLLISSFRPLTRTSNNSTHVVSPPDMNYFDASQPIPSGIVSKLDFDQTSRNHHHVTQLEDRNVSRRVPAVSPESTRASGAGTSDAFTAEHLRMRGASESSWKVDNTEVVPVNQSLKELGGTNVYGISMNQCDNVVTGTTCDDAMDLSSTQFENAACVQEDLAKDCVPNKKRISILHDAQDTLQLADKVEAHVKDILSKYRQDGSSIQEPALHALMD